MRVKKTFSATLLLGFSLLSLTACDGANRRSTGSSVAVHADAAYEPEATEEAGISDREYRLTLESLRLKQEVELRELRERHRLELERLKMEKENLIADHERALASLKEKQELEFDRLRQQHALQVADLERQISTLTVLGISAGLLFVGSWMGIGISWWIRKRMASTAEPELQYRRPPPSVTSSR